MSNIFALALVAIYREEVKSDIVTAQFSECDIVGVLSSVEDASDALASLFPEPSEVVFVVSAIDPEGKCHQVVSPNDDYMWARVSDLLGGIFKE